MRPAPRKQRVSASRHRRTKRATARPATAAAAAVAAATAAIVRVDFELQNPFSLPVFLSRPQHKCVH